MISPSRRQSGVTLMEALVALVIMAIGAASVVGMQGTLRMTGDVAKQRAEAVRLAQQSLERWRGFVGFTADGAKTDWGDIVTTGAESIVGTNATFQRTISVASAAMGADGARSKAVKVTVSWQDRTGQTQSVALNSMIAGTAPELGGALSIPASQSVLRRPGSRNPSIPRSAIDQGDGTSHFAPPGSTGVTWVFDNGTGYITQICVSSICSTVNARLLAGFVRFATTTTQPTPAEAESPPSTALPVSVSIDLDQPTSTTLPCFTYAATTYVEYACAINVASSSDDPKSWSGQSLIGGLPLASSLSDPGTSTYKVCRYTPYRDNGLDAPDDMSNAEHPFEYQEATENLLDQNFLVIRSGDGSSAFTCPNDDTSTPAVNGTTWHHQPGS